MAPSDLAKYRGVILMSVAEPGASGLWEKLEDYVHQGGGVAIFPGGEEMKPVDYNQEGAARRLLPGQFLQILSPGDNGEVWLEYQYSHPLIAPFREYAQMPETGYSENPPRTFKYWDVALNPHGLPLLKYADKERHPAILETAFDRTKIRGKVVMFTTPFDNRRDARDMPWNDYWPDWVYLAIVNKTMQYLAGEAEDAEFNFVSGRPIPVALPPGVRPNAFTLSGPGLSPADTVVPRPDQATELRLVKPHVPGHYTLATPDRSWNFSFSVNANPAEFQLVPRVPMESLKDLFPENAVVTPGQSVNLMDKLEQRAKQPLELFPWLMLLLLLFLALESFFANRFYREEPQTEVDQIGKVGA